MYNGRKLNLASDRLDSQKLPGTQFLPPIIDLPGNGSTFSRKALATHLGWEASLPQGVLLAVLNYYRLPRTLISRACSVCQHSVCLL